MKKVILNNFIFPPIQFFVEYYSADVVLIEQHDNYQKKSFRNRYIIDAPQKPQVLSIPVRKKSNYLFEKIKISYEENWPNVHIHALQSNYGKSPFYEFYIDTIQAVFRHNYDFLYELNIRALEIVLQILDIDSKHIFTKSYQDDYDSLLYEDLRGRITPTDYQKFVSSEYFQLFADNSSFRPNLSILDLIFNYGPESKNYLAKKS